MRRVCHGPFTWGRQQYIAISTIYIYCIYHYISIYLCVYYHVMYSCTTMSRYTCTYLYIYKESEKKTIYIYIYIYVAYIYIYMYIYIYVISPDITGPLRQDIPQQKAVTSP